MDISRCISDGLCYLGIELGSTRIKAVLIGEDFSPVAEGFHEWENRLSDGIWTYSLDDIHEGIRGCYRSLSENVKRRYGITLKRVRSMGVSAMMHGYMPFNESGELLSPFRTWRNTITEQASAELTELLDFNIPQRWSIAHLYKAILDKEAHTSDISYITTLAVYIHYRLTGRRVAGIGEASGMFPVKDGGYDADMISLVDERLKVLGFDKPLLSVLPEIMSAGDESCYLTDEGALFLDESGELEAGIPVCPPEGDAGTGMVASNAVRPGSGNISAGTSIFAMPVLEKPLSAVYPEIDVVTTPDGNPVAMVHCNNCCCELDTWVNIFFEFAALMGTPIEKSELYPLLYKNALENGKADGICAYNYLSGEPVTKVDSGRPMYFREPGGAMSLASFMKAQLMSSVATLTLGMKILSENEGIHIDCFTAHGGLYKVKGVAQQITADALQTAVRVTETAGEGGAWGMALLSAYMVCKGEKTLADWLESDVFGKMESYVCYPDEQGKYEFSSFLELYSRGLDTQRLFS